MATEVGVLQSKLTLDFSQFASGMNSAISMVRSFGKQLQKALGSNTTQGFSTTNQAIKDVQTSITNLQAAVTNFQSTMQNANTTLSQFSNVQANTSRMKKDLDQTANSMKKVSDAAKGTASKLGDVNNKSKKAAQNAKKLGNHLNDAQRFADNLKRILGGIVISQAFYKMLGVMQDLVSSSIEFMTNIEQSAIAFKYLLGSAEDAAGFLEVLQDFAVASPLDMRGAETAARMLMTMGFEAESVVAVLRTLTDASTVAGGDMADTVNRIALALGQMLQSGTVKMQEIRQLVNANIPIFDILQEELGLTAEQIANIGDANVDSGKAVMAILVGLQKRFGGAALEMQQTITGALSATKDSFYILFNEVMSGPYEAFRQKIVKLSDTIQALAQIARQSGAGGVFEAIIPERLHMVLRNVIGAFMQLGQAITFLGRIAATIFGGMSEIIIGVLNIILPPLTIALNTVLQFAYGLLQAYPIIKYFFAALMLLVIAKPIGAIFLWFWKIIGLGTIVKQIAGYFVSFAKVLGVVGLFFIKNPIVLGITVLVVALLAFTGVLQKAINKLKEFFSLLGAKVTNFTGMDKTINPGMGMGYDPNDILQPTNKETNDSADKYRDSLEDIESKLQDIGDEANKTSNKLKNAFNQSFDEVYTINPNTGSDLGLSGLENLDLSLPLEGLGAFNDALADLSAFDLSSWTDSFMIEWDKMWAAIKERLGEYGILALIAGVLAGLATGNPWVGLAAALAALFWPEISNALGLTEEEGKTVLTVAIAGLLGGVIASLAGLSWPAIIGVGLIAALAMAIGSGIGEELAKHLGIDLDVYADTFNVRIIGDVVAAIAAGILTATGVISAPLGLAIGAAILTAELCYPIGQKIYEYLSEEKNWTDAHINWTVCGGAIGGFIGLALGGPVGAAIGIAIAGSISEGIGAAIQAWSEGEDGWGIANAINWTTTGAGIGALIGTFIGGPAGAAIGAVIGGLVGFIVDKIVEVADSLEGGWKQLGDAFALWGKDIADAFIDGLLGDGGLFGWSTQLFEYAGDAFKEVGEAFKNQDWAAVGLNILEGILLGLAAAITFIFEPISRVFAAIVEAICAIFGIHSPAKEMMPYGEFILKGILEGIIGMISAIPGYIAEAGAALMEALQGWFTDIGTDVTEWFGAGVDAITTFVDDTGTSIGTWVSNRIADFTNFKTQASENISSWVGTAKSNITTWASETKATVSTWATDTKASISNWATNAGASVSTWWSNVKVKFDSFKQVSFTDWCNNTFKTISDWCSNIWENIKEKIGNAIDKVKEFLGLNSDNRGFNVTASVGSNVAQGHSNGGVFNREHWARFAEGNKAEAIIPLENDTAMQPFVDAVSTGITTSLAPILANTAGNNNTEQLQPLYVGTLIADERGLKELERKMQIIRIKEDRRG